jgi:hypothetical protein
MMATIDEGLRIVSPQFLMDIACNGEKPVTRDDWEKVVARVAYMIHEEFAERATRLICVLYGCPLSRRDIDEIVVEQQARRYDEASHGA